MINSDEKEFIKNNSGMIKGLIEGRLEFDKNKVIEADPEQREAFIGMVKELRAVLTTMETLLNSKDKKEGDKEFTGV